MWICFSYFVVLQTHSQSLGENLSIQIICGNLFSATHGKNIYISKSFQLPNGGFFFGGGGRCGRIGTQKLLVDKQNDFIYAFSCHELQWTSCNKWLERTHFPSSGYGISPVPHQHMLRQSFASSKIISFSSYLFQRGFHSHHKLGLWVVCVVRSCLCIVGVRWILHNLTTI